jgi:hypothetical protein
MVPNWTSPVPGEYKLEAQASEWLATNPLACATSLYLLRPSERGAVELNEPQLYGLLSTIL